jgi:hypothetical protein
MTEPRFLAEAIPFSQNPIAAVFDVSHLKEAIKPVEKACMWKTSQTQVPNLFFSTQENDTVTKQAAKCWNIPAGAKDMSSLSVGLHLELERNGIVKNARSSNAARYADDAFFRAATDSAIKALRQCAPYELSPDKYESWREMELTFAPNDMLF